MLRGLADLDHRGRSGVAARIDHRRDLDAGRQQIKRRAPAVVTGGENDGAVSGHDGEAIDIGGDRRRLITPGRSLPPNTSGRSIAPAGKHRSLGHDFPQPLPRLARRRGRQMIRHLLQRAIFPIVVGAENRGRGMSTVTLGNDLNSATVASTHVPPACPSISCRSASRRPPSSESSLHKDDAQAGSSGGERRGQPGGAAADHQHVAKGVRPVIAVRVGLHRERARGRRRGGSAARRSSPKNRRPHEGLVVEAGDEERREQLVYRPSRRSAETGPAVLAGRLQPIEQLCRRGAGVRFAPGAAAQLTSALGSSLPAVRMPRGR